jgi:hypothetical protein
MQPFTERELSALAVCAQSDRKHTGLAPEQAAELGRAVTLARAGDPRDLEQAASRWNREKHGRFGPLLTWLGTPFRSFGRIGQVR